MKLLYDQNLSHRLTTMLASEFPESIHVRDVGLNAADDSEIWSYAAQNGFVIASKDVDFQHRSLLYGHPPKVIWLRIGNRSTGEIKTLLQDRYSDILAFEANDSTSFLAISK